MVTEPLSRERREAIEQLKWSAPLWCSEPELLSLINDLFGAEEYWRGIVRELPEVINESDGMHPDYCLVCGAERKYGVEEIPHEANCGWVEAQEGESVKGQRR